MTPRQQELLSLIVSKPKGIMTADIAKHFGISEHTVKDHMVYLRAENLVVCVGRGTYATWTTPERAKAVKKEQNNNKQEKARKRQRAKYWRRKQRQMELNPAIGNQMEMLIAARGKAPASVFDLGAML